MPMHPKCFEIFKRASLRKFSKVDIDGLFLLKDVRLRGGRKGHVLLTFRRVLT